jgi:APA family basic amino acid/polyamine antiporter
MMLGQTRVLWCMSKDGLLPPFISRVHPRFKTPYVITIATGVVVAFFAALLPVKDEGNLCNIGTLLAFVIVSVGVLVLRIREPELPRKFRTPWVWFVAPMGALSSLGLMLTLPMQTWLRLLVWFVIGMVVYFSYGVRRSKLASSTQVAPAPVQPK